MYVSLSKLPSPKTQHQIFLNDFSGGVNLRRASTEIANNQSPNMFNVLWENGCLKRRPGQKSIVVPHAEVFNNRMKQIIAMHDRAIDGKVLFAYLDIDDCIAIAYCDVLRKNSDSEIVTISTDDVDTTMTDESKHGMFFEYRDSVYFKGWHCYKRIFRNDEGNLSAESVIPYTPVVMINTNPETGVGDLYQPENRLSEQKEVWYNADSGIRYAEFNCDGETTVFSLPQKKTGEHGSLLSVQSVYIGAALAEIDTDYSVDLQEGTITTVTAPPSGLKVTVEYALLMIEYTLPDSVGYLDEVWVKNLTTGEYDQYKRMNVVIGDGGTPGIGYFSYAPAISTDMGFRSTFYFCDPNGITQCDGKPVTDPNVLNSFVKVKYSKANPDAKRAIDECTVATTYGSGGLESNCIVMAGSSDQPNAFFWNGNDSTGGNPGYFPIDNYNLAGEFYDPIVLFGKQQNKLVVFQTGRIGSATFSLDEVDGRMVISLPYKTINDRFGCDLPQSVQLVENNLVWAHSKHGVLYLKDSTYAYETLVVGISGNVDPGLMSEHFGSCVSSMDDGKRYWLFVGNNAYVWDYSLQGYTSNTEKLSWFVMHNMCESNVNPVNISGKWIRICKDGRLLVLDPLYQKDFEEQMHCLFRTKDFSFGTYAYRKNVEKVIFAFPRVEGITAEVKYDTDMDLRKDLMNVHIPSGEPSDVGAFVKVRAPKCRHVHTFSVEVSSFEDKPFALMSMQILYTFPGTQSIKAGQRM
jgi:hypothetical protein